MAEKQTFTWQELSRLNSENNAHVAIRGKVYNVSRFLAKHPGGWDVLLMGTGRDVTLVFETYHAFSNKADRVLEKFYVGDLVSDELPTFPKPGLFFKTVKDRVDQYFKDTKQDPKVSWWMFLRYFLIPLVIVLSWYAQLFVFHDNFLMGCVASAILGWFCALIGMVNLHDASHFAITRNPLVWKLVGSLHDFLNGSSMHVWMYQHVLGHHPYTNIDGADPDILTSDDPPDIRRIKWSQKWFPYYIYQHIYIPLVYCFLGIKTRLQDVTILFFAKKNGAIRINQPAPSNLLIFITGKMFFILYRFIIPCAVLSLWKTIAYFIVADLVSSYWLALVFQASHVVSEVDWPEPDENGRINQDWAELQIQTTQDYATDSWFWNTFTGALNHQTTHHLFPGISQFYYPEITPIVRQTCKEFNIRYNYMSTFPKALAAHVGHLKRLGQSQAADIDTSKGCSRLE